MILLEVGNNNVKEILLQKFLQVASPDSKIEKTKSTIVDFDGAIFYVTNEVNRTILKVSLSLKFFSDLEGYNTNDLLKDVYGEFLCDTPDPEYNVTLQYDLSKLPQDVEKLATDASMLKRNCVAAVFQKFFEYQEQGITNKQAVIRYRDDETMYVNAMEDRVTVIFSTLFKDADDVVIGKFFIQAFTEAKRKCASAPQVLYSPKTPPTELKGTRAVTGDNVAYITFVLFTRHFDNIEQRRKTIDLIHTFRNYLHYHIKCSKAQIHMRMRAKSSEFLKVLVRAKPDIGISNAGSSGDGENVDFGNNTDLGVEGLNLNSGDSLAGKKTISGRNIRTNP